MGAETANDGAQTAPVPAMQRLRGALAAIMEDPHEASAKLTAGLAVAAALCSGQYTLMFSHTILAQSEATNDWSYYQAKSIKRNMSEGTADLLRALSLDDPASAQKFAALLAEHESRAHRYGQELDDIKSRAERTEKRKTLRNRQGNFFQYAFVAFQAGVVVANVSGGRRRALFGLALACGVLGLLFAAAGAALSLPMFAP